MFTFLIMLAIFVMGNWFVLLLLFPVVRFRLTVERVYYCDTKRHMSEYVVQALEPNVLQWNLTNSQREDILREIGDGWQGFPEALFTSFNMMFLDGFDLQLLNHALSPLLAKLMYVNYVVIVPLIMLNMLIALMVRATSTLSSMPPVLNDLRQQNGAQSGIEEAEAWEGLRSVCVIGPCSMVLDG
jgi:hypothetical protein